MTDDDLPEDDYAVGPGRAPLHSRFKEGQSGNLKGRPKGSLNLASIVKKEGNKKIKVKEGGRERTTTAMGAAVAQHWRKAAQGNAQSAKLMFDHVAKAEDVQSGAQPQLQIPKLDASAVRRIAERILRNIEEAASDEPISDD
ncbi:MAG: DUF5681 domain-containing protein [Roseiarcus sp.]|jgi:hypothetical protein